MTMDKKTALLDADIGENLFMILLIRYLVMLNVLHRIFFALILRTMHRKPSF